MAKAILLTRGISAVVDDADFALVSAYVWHAFPNHGGTTWYARTKIRIGPGRYKRVFMHTLITGEPRQDHKDGDGLNNRRENLRPATATQNARNKRKAKGGTSKYKGVYLFKPGIWRATIKYDGFQHSLGLFRSEEDAARAYDRAAVVHHGEFAYLNFPES